MIISLGSLLLKTEPRREDTRDVATMHVAGATTEDILKEMMDQAYDKFNLNIDNIQVELYMFCNIVECSMKIEKKIIFFFLRTQILLAKPTDHWQDTLTQGKISRLHILEPTSLQVKAALCVVDDDPRLPKTRLYAKIPSIGVSVTEQKVLDALSLATSIPLPESDTAPMALNKVISHILTSMVH